MDVQSTERFISVKEVINRTTFCRSTIRNKIMRGEFPPPIKISGNRVAWREPDLLAWMASCTEAAA